MYRKVKRDKFNFSCTPLKSAHWFNIYIKKTCLNNLLVDIPAVVVVVVDLWRTDVNQIAVTTARIKPAVRIPMINPWQNADDKPHGNDFHSKPDLQQVDIIDW
jgi:hypothetical protein